MDTLIHLISLNVFTQSLFIMGCIAAFIGFMVGLIYIYSKINDLPEPWGGRLGAAYVLLLIYILIVVIVEASGKG